MSIAVELTVDDRKLIQGLIDAENKSIEVANRSVATINRASEIALLGLQAIGIAVDNARAAKSLEDANQIREQLLEKLISAQEEERRRIARELHDEASQSLAALAINLEAVADTLPLTLLVALFVAN